jgi:DNA-binding HxlR family transcriptional regulator
MSNRQEDLFNLFGDRWALMIVDAVGNDGCSRFVEIKEKLPKASPTTLSKKLKLLGDYEVVLKATGESHLDVRYHLSAKGRDMLQVVNTMKSFFAKHSQGC